MSKQSPAEILLRRYILAAMGVLSEAEAQQSAELVGKVFSTDSQDWRQVLRDTFGLTESLDGQLAAMWSAAQQEAEKLSSELKADDFVSMIVEENFAELLEMLRSGAQES